MTPTTCLSVPLSPSFSEDIAEELDALERRMMLEMGAETSDALRFLAEESGNVDVSGNFSIQAREMSCERIFREHYVSKQ